MVIVPIKRIVKESSREIETTNTRERTMTIAAQKKITVATVKSFIRKNREKLLIKITSRFDGMVDAVQFEDAPEFTPARNRDYFDRDTHKWIDVPQTCKSTLGIQGVWFVGGGDWCQAFETDTYIGFEVSNCCGSWIVAIAK